MNEHCNMSINKFQKVKSHYVNKELSSDEFVSIVMKGRLKECEPRDEMIVKRPHMFGASSCMLCGVNVLFPSFGTFQCFDFEPYR